MPQATERYIFTPTVEKQPRYRYDTPPWEVTENDLQIDKQLADLHIETRDVETQHEVEVISQKAHDDACHIQMEYPEDNPAYPNRLMFRKVFAIRKHGVFYGLIRSLRQPLKNFKRPGITVVVGIFLTIQTDDYEQQHHDARQDHRNGFCHDQHDIADCQPIPGKVFIVRKHCKEIAHRNSKFIEICR